MPRVRFVGMKSLAEMDQAKIHAALASGETTDAKLMAYEARVGGGRRPDGGHWPVQLARPGLTARVLGPGEGLSRFYQWGPDPQSFVQDLTDADWRAVQRLPEAGQFVIVE